MSFGSMFFDQKTPEVLYIPDNLKKGNYIGYYCNAKNQLGKSVRDFVFTC